MPRVPLARRNLLGDWRPSTLDPGVDTKLSFEISMHPGMDGPHDMTIHVPVHHADGTPRPST